MEPHRRAIDDKVTTTTGRMGTVVSLLPPIQEGAPVRYLVKTDVGEAIWAEDVLRR